MVIGSQSIIFFISFLENSIKICLIVLFIKLPQGLNLLQMESKLRNDVDTLNKVSHFLI